METKESQIKQVNEQISSIAEDIAKQSSTFLETNETYKLRKKQAETMLHGLCGMYMIAHSKK